MLSPGKVAVWWYIEGGGAGTPFPPPPHLFSPRLCLHVDPCIDELRDLLGFAHLCGVEHAVGCICGLCFGPGLRRCGHGGAEEG